MQVEVQVFDHLRVTSAEGDVELGGTKQQTVLLALLLANGRVVSSDRLIEIVWGSDPPAKPNVTLRTYISHLRRALEPERDAGDRARLLITKPPGYLIDTSRIDVDLHNFNDAVDAALSLPTDTPPQQVLDATSAACAHWPGGTAGAVATATAALAEFPDEVSRLTERHLALSIRHFQAELDAGRAMTALPGLETACEQHPHSEALAALHMTALYRAGRSADALARFQQARSTLIDDFGLDPSPRLIELEQQILANDRALLDVGPPSPLMPTAPPEVLVSEAPTGRTGAITTLWSCLAGVDPSSVAAGIVGPPGIGKSTVLAALADRAGAEGISVVWGRCADTASTATLRPWQSVMRDLFELTEAGDREAIFGPQADDLSRIAPELARWFDLPDDTVDGDISDAVTRTLHRWADHRPLLVCLEDLHWADPESLAVLDHVISCGPAAPIRVIATWRDTDVAAEATQVRDARTRLLADIGRAVEPCRLTLDGLTDDDITEVFRRIQGTDPEPSDIRRLAEHTGGNPLFVTELIRAGLSPDLAPTETIRDVVIRRLDPLPDPAAEILAAASLCHPSIDESMMAELTDHDDDALADTFEAALAARLIEDHPQRIGQFRFTHDLLAETLASTLRRRRRAELHARIGALLEKRGAPDADIAHHYLHGRGAGVSLDAARFAHRAGRNAADLADYRGAIRLFDAALEALDDGPDAPSRRIDITIDRAQVLKFLSEHVESQHTSMQAFETALGAGELDLAVTAGLVYCGLSRLDQPDRRTEWLGYWSPPDESAAVLERLLEVLPDDHEHRAIVVLVLSNQLFAPHHDQQRALALANEGLALMRAAGDDVALGDGLISMASTHTRSLPHERRREMLEAALEIARTVGPPRNELRARKALMAIALDERDLAQATNHVEQALAVSATVEDPFVVMQAESMQIALDLLAGEFERASERITSAFQRYAKYGDAVTDTFGMQYFTVAKAAARFDTIIPALESRLTGYDGPAYGAPLAAVLARSGDLQGARRVVNRFTVTQITWGGEGVLQYMTPASFSEAVADLALTQPDVVSLASPLLEALAPAADRMITLVGGADYPSIGSHHLGRLLTTLGDHDAAAERLAAAAEHLTTIEARPALLWTRLAMAENDAAAGRTEAASARLRDVAADAESMGMTWAVDWERDRIQQLFNLRR